MKSELGAWNNGAGINLEGWAQCTGNFALAVGYATVFWPRFVAFENYVLCEGFSESSLRGFASSDGATKQSVEAVMNHLHIADIQHGGCKDLSKDKILVLGNTLREIYEAKLKWQFPDRSFAVEFHKSAYDEDDLIGYQLTFWQK